MSDTEDYEAIRLQNIAEREAFMKQFMMNIGEDLEVVKKLENNMLSKANKENRKPRTPRPRTLDREQRHSVRNVKLDFIKKYNTRSKKRKLEGGEDEEKALQDLYDDKDIIVSNKKRSLKVMFSWSRPIQRDIDLMNLESDKDDESDEDYAGGSESDDEMFKPKKRKYVKISKAAYDPSTIPSPDEITQKMLDNVALKATNKTYDAMNGTSCHQCRQKTKDTKTVCRSGECIGVRGQFCGPCLRGRYGESAYEALKDPNWACPPCRGLCNCSICRTRNGQRPTGILAPIAKEEGFKSVKDYLEACED